MIAFAPAGPGPAALDVPRNADQPAHTPHTNNTSAGNTRVDRSSLKLERFNLRIPRSGTCHPELRLVPLAAAIVPLSRGAAGKALSCGREDGGCSTESVADRNCISFSGTASGVFGFHS